MIAAGHIIGALIASVVLSTLLFFFGVWIDKLRAQRVMEQASLDLAVPLSELSSPSFEQSLIRYLGAKYSDDLLKNRISDLVGFLLSAFNWVVLLIELAILGFAVWLALAEDQSNAIYAWLVLPVSLIAFCVAMSVHFACKILTGRYPAQARHARKILAQGINQASAPAH